MKKVGILNYLKNLKYYRKKNTWLFILFFITFNLIIGATLVFFSSYYQSFENAHDLTFQSDISISSYTNDFKSFQTFYDENLTNSKILGYKASKFKSFEVNWSTSED